MSKRGKESKFNAPIIEAPDEIRKIIRGVLKLEHEHLWNDKPRLSDDVVIIIKKAISGSEEA